MEHTITGVGVIDKSMSIMAAIEAGPLNLAALTEVTGLTKATTHRLATALEDHGLLGRDAEGRFTLGARLVTLGRSAMAALTLGDAAHDALEWLRSATGESVQLYVRDGDRRVCVESLESPHGLRTIVPLGATFTMASGGSAATVLLDEPEVAQQGWVASVGEREAGVASVSAPVRGPDGAVVAAVSVSGPVERTTTDPGGRYADAVTEAAAMVEDALNGHR